MTKHIWSVLCSKSSTDKETNNISLFEIIEQLSFNVGGPDAAKAADAAQQGHIVAPINFEVVSLFEREDVKKSLSADVKVGVVDPTGKNLNDFKYSFHFIDGKRRMRNTLKMNGMPITKSGIYRILIMVKDQDKKDWKIVTELPIEVAVNFN